MLLKRRHTAHHFSSTCTGFIENETCGIKTDVEKKAGDDSVFLRPQICVRRQNLSWLQTLIPAINNIKRDRKTQFCRPVEVTIIQNMVYNTYSRTDNRDITVTADLFLSNHPCGAVQFSIKPFSRSHLRFAKISE